MSEHLCEKISFSKYFTEQSYSYPPHCLIPKMISCFFGYKKPVTVLFRQYYGFEVFAFTPVSVNMGNINSVMANIHTPLMHHMETTALLPQPLTHNS